MKRELREVGASVRAKLLDQARKEQSDFQLLLTRYVLERLLYRLSVSEYRHRFVLKGALLLSVWVGDRYRPTRDLDLLGYGDTSPEELTNAFRAICSEAVIEDGVVFDIDRLQAEPIREAAEYAGVRIQTTATVARARIPVQVDVGFGDTITPAPVEVQYPVLLQFPAPHLRAYPVETIIAEKLEALVVLGIANSRLKDYYDLFLISRTFALERSRLAEAIQRTFERRGTAIPDDIPLGLTNKFADAWQKRWSGFLGREQMLAVPDNLQLVVASVREFVLPAIGASFRNLQWLPGGPWSQ